MWGRIAFASFLLSYYISINVPHVSAGILSSAYKGYKAGKEITDFVSNVLSGLDVYVACKAAGGSDDACSGKATVCYLYKQFGSPFTEGIWQSGYAESLYRYLCLGQPVLKCCYRIDDDDCHSAFNDDAPINCEGNPFYGPTNTAGLCRAPCPTCPGCLCDYIPKCQTLSPPLDDNNIFSPYDDPEFHVYRMDNFIVELGFFFKREFNNEKNDGDIFPSINPLGLVPLPNLTILEEVMDFVRFRGCQSFSHNIQLLGDAIPNLIPVNFRGDELFRPNDYIDQLPAIRQMLPYFVVARLVVDIPYFWLKIDYINAIPLNTTQISTALRAAGITDPARDILNWIDYGGLYILQRILGDKWKLLTIPVNFNYYNLTESPITPALKSCAKTSGRASPVRINSLEVSLNGSLCSVKLTLAKGQGEVLVRVFWGDRINLDEPILNTTTTGLLLLSHIYTTCGPQRISIQLTNEGRLRTLALTTVRIPCNIQLPPTPSLVSYPNVAYVYLQVNISVAFREDDSGNQFFLFEGASSIGNTTLNLTDINATFFKDLGTHVSKGGTNLPQQANLIFQWDSSPLEVLRFTCRTINNYLYTASAASINKVQIELMNREIIDVKFTQSPPEPILCARRGDIFEDEQEVGIVSSLPASGGTILPAAPPSVTDEYFKKDGYYYEQYPNRFSYSRSLAAPTTPSPAPTATPKCGIFGLSLICPLKCGVLKRLLGLGGC